MYIYERSEWPEFRWDQVHISELLASVKYQQGKLLGKMERLGFELRQDALVKTLTEEVVKTSEIEGELLDEEQVRSSIARHLGVNNVGLAPADRHVEGIVEVMLDAARHFDRPLTEQRLFGWHSAIFPSSMSGMHLINVGMWRTDAGGPMQIVSGAYGKERVHFRAPAAALLEKEMRAFFTWFNEDSGYDWLIKASIAHFWFVTLHPFDDGNGRVARAIAEMAISRSEGQRDRFYNMSSQIRKERKEYYRQLELTSRGSLNITSWMEWFLSCLQRAILHSENVLEMVLNKAKFWDRHVATIFNDRQLYMLKFLFEGFKGKLTTVKWAKMTKCSHDTATRDINDLINQQVLLKDEAGGRSTHYLLKNFPINQIE